ncbi:MAG: DUF3987 domain-containing protein [Candidatus Neptunochlamydia sp.]|nr:DUF3987 domain-containing protein [Candidatus Neptunochlamydia sp.]
MSKPQIAFSSRKSHCFGFKRDPIAPGRFPFEALGPILGPPAKRIHEIVKAPDSICGNSLLAVAALITQRHADVHIDGRVHPLSLFILTVAESGDRKSAVEKIVLKPIQSFEKAMFKDYSHQIKSYKDSLDIWKIQRGSILKDSDSEKIKSQLRQLDNEPTPPLLPHLLLEEPTFVTKIRLMTCLSFALKSMQFTESNSKNTESKLKVL